MCTRSRVVLQHLDGMSDSTGLIQHAIYGIPRRESGYTTDDNSRALRLCVRLWAQRPDAGMLRRVTRYLSFLEYACCPRGRFRNLLSYSREWLDAAGTDDCQGQALRALAEVLGSSLPEGHRLVARELIEAVLPTLTDLRSIRAQAYVILGWGHLHASGTEELGPLEVAARAGARRLLDCFHAAARPDWPWFESSMTYANAVLPHALLVASDCWPHDGFLDAAKASFAFLDEITTVGDLFWPVGNAGWYSQGGVKAPYDQQPIEAATMAEAALTAFQLLGDEQYLDVLRRARAWFHGGNSLKQPLANNRHGGCCDGLQVGGGNRNQGAESTLAYLWTAVQDSAVKRRNQETTRKL